MPDFGSDTFSQTDANNATGTMPSWNGAAAPSTIDDAGRALQGAVTREWNWRSYTITAGGTADAKTLTYSVAPAAYYNGQRFAFIANTTNTASVTLNVNVLGAKTIRKDASGTLANLVAGDMVSGMYVEVVYNLAADVFVWVNQKPVVMGANGSIQAPFVTAGAAGVAGTKLTVSGGSSVDPAQGGQIMMENTQISSKKYVRINDLGYFQILNNSYTNPLLNIADSGEFFIGNLSPAVNNVAGWSLWANGFFSASRDSTEAAWFNRRTNDGAIVVLAQDGVAEGTISVAGTTVSYNSFAGSHWSQLEDGSKPDIQVGTVVETVDAMCLWPGEQNDQLPRFKVSDTPKSQRVYGVFMGWDNDYNHTNDAYITGVGAYLIRISAGVKVKGGDLLESAGNGCAQPQSDDVVRASTIGKVTSSTPHNTYADGSYTVPVVLYCG